jgi:hypothetical protein
LRTLDLSAKIINVESDVRRPKVWMQFPNGLSGIRKHQRMSGDEQRNCFRKHSALFGRCLVFMNSRNSLDILAKEDGFIASAAIAEQPHPASKTSRADYDHTKFPSAKCRKSLI